jgi:hypothetical protein
VAVELVAVVFKGWLNKLTKADKPNTTQCLWLPRQSSSHHRGSSVRNWEFGLCHPALRCWIVGGYLALWLARWISPDSAGAVDGLNLYVYVSNNPLKYRDPTGHVCHHRGSSVRNWEFGLCHPALRCWIVGGCWVGSGFGVGVEYCLHCPSLSTQTTTVALKLSNPPVTLMSTVTC